MFEIMKSGFYSTNLEQINSRKLLNLFFKHFSPIHDPKMAILIPIFLPMTFAQAAAYIWPFPNTYKASDEDQHALRPWAVFGQPQGCENWDDNE